MIIQCRIATYFNAETQGAQRELEFRVGEWWGVFSHKEQEKQEVSGVGVGEWSWRVELESGVGGGAEVRANGYGVFAEVP